MTRLLMPEMFGVMAIANIFLVGLALFSDLGLRQNIIQSKRGDDPLFLNTVWTIQILRGAVLWALTIGVGLMLNSLSDRWLGTGVYAHPILPFVVGMLAINALIGGFESTKIATANRKLVLGKFTQIEIISQLAGLTFTISWALLDRSIWALVAGSIISTLTRTFLSHTMLPGETNRFQWEADAFHDVVYFGKWIFLSSILGFLLRNGDRLILGGLVDATTLGLYSIAFLLLGVFQRALGKFRTMVIFPVLSIKFREKESNIVGVYYKFRLIQDAVISIVVGFVFVSGEAIIDLLYDDRYLGAGQMLQILSLMLISQRYALADHCYLAMGKPRLMTLLISIRMLLLYLSLPVGYYLYGMDGALWGIAVSNLLAIPFALFLKARFDMLDAKKEFLTIPLVLPGAAFGWILVKLVPYLT